MKGPNWLFARFHAAPSGNAVKDLNLGSKECDITAREIATGS
jgi:hypothetical protein